MKASRQTAPSSSNPAPHATSQPAFGPASVRGGHHAAAAALRNHIIQRKLTVGDPNDLYEQEADRVADQVLRMPDPVLTRRGIDRTAIQPLSIQRLCKECEQEEELQRQRQRQRQRQSLANDAGSSGLETVATTLRQSGRPLDPPARAFFEPRFGVDFSAVRIHTNTQASESARSVNALAYTVGHNVVFNSGQYAPQSDAGRRLLAHELTHVLQQGGIRSSDTPTNVQHLSARPRCLARQAVPPAAAPIPILTITRQGSTGNTFVSSETISFAAQLTGVPNAADLVNQVSWTVRSVSANSGTGSPPTATSKSQFSFKPNPTNRPTTGSRSANAPIQIAVDAQASGATTSANLEQDEADIIRQEYVDFGATPPGRGSLVSPANANFNVGNYSLIVDNGLAAALSTTVAKFQQLTQAAAQPAPAAAAVAPAAPTAAAAAPVAAPAPPAAPSAPVPAISVESGYRNPRRNVAAGSKFPVTSRHVWGSALDLSVAGADALLWQRLRNAGASAGTSICEDGPTQKECNDASVDHVHVQW